MTEFLVTTEAGGTVFLLEDDGVLRRFVGPPLNDTQAHHFAQGVDYLEDTPLAEEAHFPGVTVARMDRILSHVRPMGVPAI